jgi:hypothetical protein
VRRVAGSSEQRASGRKSAAEGAAWVYLVPGGSGELFAAGVEMN